MKREFKEYKADGIDDRDESTIEVHEVTKETAGEVRTRTGVVHVSPGDVLVKTYRPDEYDVMKKEQLDELEYDCVTPFND